MTFWQHLVAGRAFRTWHHVAFAARDLRDRLHVAVGRWRNGTVSRCFLQWRTVVRVRRAARSLLTRHLLRAAVRAFNSWRLYVHSLRRKRKAVLLRSVQHWRRIKCVLALRRLRAHAAASSSRRFKARLALRFYFGTTLQRAWVQWRVFHRQQVGRRLLAISVAHRFRASVLRRRFSVLKRLLGRRVTRRRRQAAAVIQRAWQRSVLLSERSRYVQARVAVLHSHQVQRRAKYRAAVLMPRTRQALLRRVFDAWEHCATMRFIGRRHNETAHHAFGSNVVRRVFAAWFDFANPGLPRAQRHHELVLKMKGFLGLAIVAAAGHLSPRKRGTVGTPSMIRTVFERGVLPGSSVRRPGRVADGDAPVPGPSGASFAVDMHGNVSFSRESLIQDDASVNGFNPGAGAGAGGGPVPFYLPPASPPSSAFLTPSSAKGRRLRR